MVQTSKKNCFLHHIHENKTAIPLRVQSVCNEGWNFERGYYEILPAILKFYRFILGDVKETNLF